MKIEVRSAIADILKLEGVEYLFGHTGGHIMEMRKAAAEAGIKLILNKQEGNGVFMADAFARLTNKPAVITGTAGPGVQNMVNGIASAYLDSVPLIVIGATPATYTYGKNALQDASGRGRSVEQRIIFKQCCKQAMFAPSPETIPDMVREAFKLASSGRPGPVYIEIPRDVWSVEIEYERISPERYKNLNIPKCDASDCTKIVDALYNSKYPLIMIGEGAMEKGKEEIIMEFINETKIPFTASPLGKNLVDEYHELYLGGLRSMGTITKQAVYEYMNKSDFILFLGDRLNQWEIGWEYEKINPANTLLAQIDPDYAEIGRIYPVNYSAVGSISSFISSINIKEHKRSEKLKNEVDKMKSRMPRINRAEDSGGINPININNIVEELADDDATIVCDTGWAGVMAITRFRTKLTQKFLHSDKNSPMGYAIPASFGAYLATGKETICFTGDGSAQMVINELGILLEHKLKVIIIIENNHGCKTISALGSSVNGHDENEFKNPDYTKIAQAYNIKGYRAETTEEFEQAFKEAKKSDTSVIIDTKLNQSIMTW